MPFDPNLPTDGALIIAAELRSQFQGLHDEITAVPTVTAAAVDTVMNLPPGSLPSASASLSSGTVHFTFGLVQGIDGPQGPPGEVTQSQLTQELATAQTNITSAVLAQTSANSNAVPLLNLTVSDPPTQAEMQAVANKLDELIAALRR